MIEKNGLKKTLAFLSHDGGDGGLSDGRGPGLVRDLSSKEKPIARMIGFHQQNGHLRHLLALMKTTE